MAVSQCALGAQVSGGIRVLTFHLSHPQVGCYSPTKRENWL
jgi:hypothetical protein